MAKKIIFPKFVTVSNGNITQNVQRDSTKIVYASNHMKKIDFKL